MVWIQILEDLQGKDNNSIDSVVVKGIKEFTRLQAYDSARHRWKATEMLALFIAKVDIIPTRA